MRIFFILLLSIIINRSVYTTEVNIIDLHGTKSLDQLVLENELDENENNNYDLKDENISLEEISVEEENAEEENYSIENDVLDVSNFFGNVDINELNFYFNNINTIYSPTLYDEFIKILTDFNFDENNVPNSEIVFLFIKKLVDLGEIQKAYNLINSLNFEDDENLIYYKTIELNYLFSTYQLKEACELKNEFNLQKLILPNYYLEKADIFCLVMEEKKDEANLLNSILIETEKDEDQYFQNLLNILINYKDDNKNISLILPGNYSENLIFLYSAMLRIAEMPLNEKFLEIDPNNLSIPIILSNSTPLELRIKAAHKAYTNNLISIESLAALYQSVDFNSEELNNPKKTLERYKASNELIMAYYYQLVNIQIFPSSRLSVIFDFWQFAETIDLEKISYNLTYNIISSIEPSSDKLNFGNDIATALIYNNDYENASKWIIFSENSNDSTQELEKVKLLYDLYKSSDSQKILEYINNNFENLKDNQSANFKEILYVILYVFDQNTQTNSSLIFEKIMDERKVPTIFLYSKIEEAINNKDEFNLLMLLLMSINEKEWNQIHPEHLKLVLRGIKNYQNSKLLKNIILNIFENNKIL